MGLVNLYRIKKLYDKITDGRKHPKKLKDAKWWESLFKAAWAVEEVRIMLSGYKTYLVAIGTAILAGAKAMGYIDEQAFQALLALLAGSGLATMRSAFNKAIEKK